MDWQALGFSVVKGVSSGTQAKDYLLNDKPDLMITDIRMPKISGLELASLVVQEKLETKVIILSGYSDFSYAQKAIRLGTIDYLLKPITGKDLLPVINKVLLSLPKKATQQKIEKERIVQFFVEGFSTLVVQPQIFFEDSKWYLSLTETYIPGSIQVKMKDVYFTVTPENLQSPKTISEDTILTKQNLQTLLYNFFEINEESYHFPEELHTLILEKKWKSVLSIIQEMKDGDKLFPIFQIDLLQAFSKQFPKLLMNLDLTEMIEGNKIESFLIGFMKEAAIFENKKSNANQVAIDKIIQLIRRDYGEDITLDTLSAQVYMHPVTISRIFKAITGSTISSFLCKVRLEAAADLLEHSNLLVSDVGKMVGYHKTQYFIKLFKQKYGVTPQKYRRKILLEGENNV